MSDTHLKGAIGIEQAMRGVLVDSAPGGEDRIRRYNAVRQQLKLPPYYLAAISDVVEGIGCNGRCTARQVNGVRLVDVRPGCTAHARPGDRR